MREKYVNIFKEILKEINFYEDVEGCTIPKRMLNKYDGSL
jgi:hypothetical protein